MPSNIMYIVPVLNVICLYLGKNRYIIVNILVAVVT